MEPHLFKDLKDRFGISREVKFIKINVFLGYRCIELCKSTRNQSCRNVSIYRLIFLFSYLASENH